MIPNMAKTVLRKSIPLVIKRTTTTIVKGRPVEAIADVPIMGFLKPLQMQKVVKAQIDYSLEYVHYVGINEVKINDLITRKDFILRDFIWYDYIIAKGNEISFKTHP